MKISIITATYNSEKTLSICMDSVLNQSYSDIEYILVDGESTDETINLIEQKAKNHTNVKWISEPDKGIYDALNKGINMASGEVIGFVHSDDFLAENTILEKIAYAFKQHSVDGVYGNLHYVSFESPDTVVRNWKSQAFRTKLLNRGWMPAHPTVFLKSSVYKEKGLFDINFKIAADYDFMLRVFSETKYRFYFLPEVITKMRVGGKSNSNLKNIIKKTKEDYQAAKKNGLFLPFNVILSKNLSKIPQWFYK